MISEDSTFATGSRVRRSTLKPKRGQANKRERVRTENVNVGFDNLRKLIPTDPVDRKLSKIEVLRLATSYINHLYNLTRASSCIEAEELAGKAFDSSNSDDDDVDNVRYRQDAQYNEGGGRINGDVGVKVNGSSLNKRNIDTTRTKIGNKSIRRHVCTFCLMMTKSTATSASTKRK